MVSRQGFRVTVLAAMLVVCTATANAQDSRADGAKVLLQRGLDAYSALDFRQAKALLMRVDAGTLSPAQRAILNQRLGSVDTAMASQAKARDALAAGQTAMAAGKLAEAEQAFRTAAASRFLPADQRATAARQAALAARKRQAALAVAQDTPSAPKTASVIVSNAATADDTKDAADSNAAAVADDDNTMFQAIRAKRDKARQLLDEAKKLIAAGQNARAKELLQEAVDLDPNLPEARKQLDYTVGLLAGAKEDSAITLLGKRRSAARQMADMEITKQLGRSNELLAKADSSEDFKTAENAAQLAMDVLVKNRELFTASEYRSRANRIKEQTAFVQKRLAAWTDARTQKQLDQMRRIEADRVRKQQLERGQRIMILTERARTLKTQQKYREALEEVKHILTIDRTNRWAAEQKDILTQFILLRDKRLVASDFRQQFHETMIQQKISEIPWKDEMIYPRDWREITDRRKGQQVSSAAESEANRAVRQKLKQRIKELNFEDIELKDVIQFLRDVSAVNIYVKWNALAAAGIGRNTTVNIHLADVTLEKALSVILEDVGAAAPLGYVLNEGVVTISTRDDLATKTITRVYDIRDLIFTVPQFSGPRLSLQGDGTDNNGTNNDAGTGVGLGGEDLGLDESVSQEEVVNDIINLIRTTVAQDTWNDENRVGIQAMSGQLVITQTSENHERIGELLSRLREAGALQVSIESRFITVQDSWLERIGLEATVTIDNEDHMSHLTAPLTFGGAEIEWAHAGGATGVGLDIASAAVPTAFEIDNTYLDDIQVAFIIRATMANANARVLTAPRVTLYNGQRSYISIRRTQTYVSEFTLTREVVDDGAGNQFERQEVSVETADLETGTLLDVQVTVSDDRRYVTLTLRPQISSGTTRTLTLQDFTGSDGSRTISALELPSTLNSEVSTTVSCPDGGTLMIGGLKRAGERERELGVPVLSRVPILAPLVTNRGRTRDDDVLLILIKPTIIIQSEKEDLAFP